MYGRFQLVNVAAIALLGVSSVVTTNVTSSDHGDDLGMHLRCTLCRDYPKEGPTDQRCIERCQNGTCKHVQVVYPPD